MLDKQLIRDHMTKDPISVPCHISVEEANKMMEERKFRHLPVMQGPKLVGILSERDIAIIQAIQTTDPAKITVTEAMTPQPYVCKPDDTLLSVAMDMIDRNIGAAIVQEDGEVVGIYTTVDALRTVVKFVGSRNL